MGLIGNAHGDNLAEQEEFSSEGFGLTATSPHISAVSSSSNGSTQANFERLAETGPSTFHPPLFGAASSSNICNPANFGSATGPSAFSPPLSGAASSGHISNPANFEFAASGPSASPPPLFGAAPSGNITNPADFGLAATGPYASPPPLFGAVASTNISNPAYVGSVPAGPSVFQSPIFDASHSDNTTNPTKFSSAGTSPVVFRPPLSDVASSSNISKPFNFGTVPSLFRPSLFAASSCANSSSQALSSPAFLPPCTYSFSVSPSFFAAEKPTATSTFPLSGSSSSNMTSLPKQSFSAPSSSYNSTTVASPPLFGSSSSSSLVARSSAPSYCFLNMTRSQTDSCPSPSAPSSSIFTTTVAATVLPPEDSLNKREFSFGGFGSPASPSTFRASSSSISSTQAMLNSGFLPFTNSVNAFSSLSSQIINTDVGFDSSKFRSSPTDVLFPPTPTTTTMASPPVSNFGFWPPGNSSNAIASFDFSKTPLHCFANIPSLSQKDSTTIFATRSEQVQEPTPHLCPSCGQTLLSRAAYAPTLDFEQDRAWMLESISAMPQNQAKSHEELRWANHVLQGQAKDNVAPVAQSTISSQPQWTLPVMLLPVMSLPTWNILSHTPASASTLPAFAANGAAFGYASSSPSFSGTPFVPAVFNLCDMFRRP